MAKATAKKTATKKPAKTKAGGKPTGYVAFLLGINIGPNKRVPMPELKKMCERMGFENVRTVIASGNVVFDAEKQSPAVLARRLEAALKKAFGFEVGVIVRTAAEIEKMLKAEPFKGITVTKDTRFHVTFLAEPPKGEVAVPPECKREDAGYRILDMSGGAVYGVLDLSKAGSPDAMKIIAKLFGKKTTMRNWNTIEKLVRA